MSIQRPLSLVTGASAGIGAAFARELAARGHDLVLVARRAERLHAMAGELQQRYGSQVHVLPSDLADPAAPSQLAEALQREGLAVDWLVNNAGYGVPGTFEASDWPVHADFLRVLLAAPTELAWRLLPGMRERGYGRIVNVASLAGHVPGSAGHTRRWRWRTATWVSMSVRCARDSPGRSSTTSPARARWSASCRVSCGRRPRRWCARA